MGVSGATESETQSFDTTLEFAPSESRTQRSKRMNIELLVSSIASHIKDQGEEEIDDTLEFWLFSRRKEEVDGIDNPLRGWLRTLGTR
jgi:hypothetical protein